MFKLKKAEEAIISQLSKQTIDILDSFNDNLSHIFDKENKLLNNESSDVTEKEFSEILKTFHLENAYYYILPKINNNEFELLIRLFELSNYRVLTLKKRIIIVLN